ncbi:MAG: hypothetical protein OEV49_09895 [candidate division Zixibacteria bacterium]|nr:hypothetical protein [candidate division Zixibacteria bacterium]MDH3938365.1 hypothetical protein [candidate division Zixibacteria bacterium]MDH4035180.1 hypothetical protein [candidate division Zixibacteria bacterium]
MNKKFSKARIAAGLVLMALVVISMSVILSIGCTKRLDGELNPNQKPVVYFVNIPPEGHKFSRNPEIHWVGTDRDGLISYFRYHVATAEELGGIDPMDYIELVAANAWVRLDVDPKGPDPMTSNIVAMSANLTDPVLTYVDQFVFLQAYDEEGLGSDIVYRVFSRNDNPPNSFVFGFHSRDIPFVNSVEPGGIITGVKLHWQGEDLIDYPSDPPPFEFDWRLYGPYFDEDMEVIRDSFQDSVYVTNDGGVYRMGDTVIRCDTFYLDTSFTETCDTLVVNPLTPTTAFGGLEPYFRIDDPDFIGSKYNTIQQSEGWVTNTYDTLWNVFAGKESDTTVQMTFIFWLRSRDDAQVPDLVPYYREIPVIDPRYERDIAVIDFSKPTPAGLNDPIDIDTSKAYWKTTIDKWGANTGRHIVFDTTTIREGPLRTKDVSPDYLYMGKLLEGAPIAELLKHKVMIIYDDVPGMPQPDQWLTIYKSIDAGINAWMTGRTTTIAGSPQQPPTGGAPSFQYQFYFGVDSVGHFGWHSYIPPFGRQEPSGLWQDFVGTYSRKPGEWPDLEIDSALLHQRYKWVLEGTSFSIPYWNEDCPALPYVDWSVRSFGTEILYKYKSCYGPSHPLGNAQSFNGRPVAHRLTTSLFKTAHFNFTPMAIDSIQMQVVVDSLLNWLYDPDLGSILISENRNPDAQVKMSLSEARENLRVREEAYRKKDQGLMIIE